MIMKSRRILAVLAACTAVTFTGCGVVTVVPIGEEASYTGKQEFDSAAESQGDWGAVVADISDKAQDLSELLNGRTGWIYRNYRGSGPDRWTELQHSHP